MKLIAILFAVFLFALVILANLGLGSSFYSFIRIVPGGDKTGHFLLFGFMSFFLNSAFYGKLINLHSFKMMKGSFILIMIITIEELSQHFIPSRTFSLLDLVASYLGVFCFAEFSKSKHNYFTIFHK